MPESNFKLRDVAWIELVPWISLTRCVWIALMPRVLFMSAIGLVLVTAGWQVISSGFDAGDDPILSFWQTTGCAWVWQDASQFAVAASESPDSAAELFGTTFRELIDAPIFLWTYLTRPFVLIFDGQVSFTGVGCLLLCGIWEILVWALIGGSITRIAALKLTRGETPDLVHAVRFASRWLLSYCAAPLMALAAAVLFALLLAFVGWTMRFDILALVVAFAWPFVFFFSFLIALLLIGLLVGWPFMWATISVEGTDAFDAVSRCYAYAYQRPFHLVWYVLFAGGVGALGMFAIKVFVVATIALGDWSIQWGLDTPTFEQVVDLESSEMAEEAVPSSSILAIASTAVQFWKSLLATVAAGYQAGFLWTAAVGIYLLLRRSIDSAEMDEVFIDDEEPDFGMPPLEDDETGVPSVSTTAPAHAGDT